MAARLIGLTGGIGSGKTTIANFFKEQGIPLYIADDEAKTILYTPDAVKEVREAFGKNVFTNEMPDRSKLASVVFSDPEKLKTLNAIIHPKVKEHFQKWMEQHNNEKFVIREAAILFESGSYIDCDKIILVTAPLDLRIRRVMERDKTTREKVLERINAQWDDKKKEELSDFIITNIELENAKAHALEILKILNKMEK
ncbi:dephospho-CoA kinase [Flavobacterium sp. DG1-102-2]|uniref:dephospho-CoA kinase n=1 Tax=Flavobacterium sp. DG1-102-2 TaxID=3081663 RepID=UPI00294A0E91|nr:dephospho-CoA kinase [Flavobacterium sp. DG1-102-2]MDV6169966.1 dephospho-CoA kinase [Flavobacterium sp. DG1-102-2]